MWRVVLFVGVLLALVLAGVGVVLDLAAVEGGYNTYREKTWPFPFGREVWAVPGGSGPPVTRASGDEMLWYFAAGAVLVLTLAAMPLLRERERRQRGDST